VLPDKVISCITIFKELMAEDKKYQDVLIIEEDEHTGM